MAHRLPQLLPQQKSVMRNATGQFQLDGEEVSTVVTRKRNSIASIKTERLPFDADAQELPETPCTSMSMFLEGDTAPISALNSGRTLRPQSRSGTREYDEKAEFSKSPSLDPSLGSMKSLPATSKPRSSAKVSGLAFVRSKLTGRANSSNKAGTAALQEHKTGLTHISVGFQQNSRQCDSQPASGYSQESEYPAVASSQLKVSGLHCSSMISPSSFVAAQGSALRPGEIARQSDSDPNKKPKSGLSTWFALATASESSSLHSPEVSDPSRRYKAVSSPPALPVIAIARRKQMLASQPFLPHSLSSNSTKADEPLAKITQAYPQSPRADRPAIYERQIPAGGMLSPDREPTKSLNRVDRCDHEAVCQQRDEEQPSSRRQHLSANDKRGMILSNSSITPARDGTYATKGTVRFESRPTVPSIAGVISTASSVYVSLPEIPPAITFSKPRSCSETKSKSTKMELDDVSMSARNEDEDDCDALLNRQLLLRKCGLRHAFSNEELSLTVVTSTRVSSARASKKPETGVTLASWKPSSSTETTILLQEKLRKLEQEVVTLKQRVGLGPRSSIAASSDDANQHDRDPGVLWRRPRGGRGKLGKIGEKWYADEVRRSLDCS